LTGNQELIEQYARLHASEAYGNTSVKNLRFLKPEIQLLRPRSIIDYGCGQSRLLELLGLERSVKLARYDPAIPEFSEKPNEVFDLLVNIDVLEHIEEDDLDSVLAEMRSICRDAIIIVDTRPAKKILPDGRNAHATVRQHAWWREKISTHFGELHHIGTARRTRAGFKTWTRSTYQSLIYSGLRVVESARHYSRRLVRS
jgi:Methyltransferase domain